MEFGWGVAVMGAVAVMAAVAGGCASGDDAAPSAGAAEAAATAPASASTTTANMAAAITTTLPTDASFTATVSPVTTEQLGASWHVGCPVGATDLRAVDLAHWGIDGRVHHGRLVVAAAETDHVVAAFRELFDARYPIEAIVPVDAFGGDDDASMAANNTSAFNCRTVAGTDRLSEHAFGRAIDVNPLLNPYVTPAGIFPPTGARYADRTRTDPGLIHDGDAVVVAFAHQGWEWGGHWSGAKDYQHLSASGR
jgi:hypothetical protein